MNRAFSITAAELSARGFADLPPELNSARHMIYSSPATLDYNSPGAKGFGVKRAGLAIPGSVMLLGGVFDIFVIRSKRDYADNHSDTH